MSAARNVRKSHSKSFQLWLSVSLVFDFLPHLLVYKLKVYDSINSSENLNLSVTNTGLMAAL